MCARFDEWKSEIEEFCASNGLDFKKTANLVQSSNQDMLVLQHYDPEKGKRGLLDETPMPVVLWAFRDGSSVRFEQTEHTKRYLS